MAVLVALLRGINVGSTKRMKMDALRKVFTDLGFTGVRTYLQSGNVVFQSAESNGDKLRGRVEDAIAQAFAFRCDVIFRSNTELQKVTASNPFAERHGIEPAKLLVLFLDGQLSIPEKRDLAEIDASPEEIAVRGSEVYIHYPNGMGRSRLDVVLAKLLKRRATGRNWNSVTSILAVMNDVDEV